MNALHDDYLKWLEGEAAERGLSMGRPHYGLVAAIDGDRALIGLSSDPDIFAGWLEEDGD
jgi:hypothetical protein